MRINPLLLLSCRFAFIFSVLAFSPFSRAGLITNDAFFKDTSGTPIYSQGGGIFRFGDRYYWYGVKYNGAVSYANNPAAGENGDTSFVAITCYSSTDLVNWKFENNVLTASTPGLGSVGWLGRMGVAYNATTNKYVLLTQYSGSASATGGVLFATCDTPTGNFVFNNIQYPIPGVVNNNTGDQSLFIDDDGQPYLICSSSSGRSNWYVARLRPSDYLAVETATRIGGGAGREGNCMFKYNGRYYFCSSDLHGWNASHCYVISATNILGPYGPESIMTNTDADFCHVSQTGFFFNVTGSDGTTVVFAGDRWSDFAGNGLGYNQWCPLSFDGATPIFNSLSKWNLDAAAGTWSVAAGNNYILNPTYEADRVSQTAVAGWITDPTSTAGSYANASGGRTGNWRFRHSSSAPYSALTHQLVTGLPNGSYSVKVWYRSSGGQSAARIFARNYGDVEIQTNINTAAPGWTLATIPKFAVTNGQADIGVFSNAAGNQWVDVDDWELIQTPPGPDAAITSITPDTGASTSDFVTTAANLTLSGTAGFSNSVAITRVGAGVVGNVNADTSGHWTFDYSATTLPEGTHVFQIVATDAPSGLAFPSEPVTVVVDHTPPVAPVISSVNSVAGSLQINGTTEPNASVAVLLDGGTSVGSVAADASGNWSLSEPSAISAGTHTFSATATDLAGNVGSGAAGFIVNTSIPAPSIVSAQSDGGTLLSGAVSTDKTLLFSGTAPAGAIVTLSRVGEGQIGTATADGGGNWTFDSTASPLPEGLQRFSATSTIGGQTSAASAFFDLIVDTIAPSVVSIVRQSPTFANISNSVPSVTFRVTFSESVSGVAPASFSLVGTASGNISSVSASSGKVFDVIVDTLAGAGTLRLDLKASASGIFDIAGYSPSGYTAGDTYTRASSSVGSGTWTRIVPGGVWSDENNWLNAVIPGTVGDSADFNSLNLVANNTVSVDSPRIVNSLTFGDTDISTPGSWVLDGNGDPSNTLTLGGTPTITVNGLGTGATAAIALPLAGTAGFNKAGSGTLVLSAPNTISGTLNIAAGTVSVGPGATFSPGTVNISTGGGLLLISGGNFNSSGTTNVTGSGSTLQVDSGTAVFNAIAGNNNTGNLVKITGGTVTAGSVSFQRSSDTVLNYATGLVVTGGTTTIGAINLGTGNSNALMSVEGGAVTATGAVTLGNQTTGGRGGHLRVTGGTFTSTDGSATGGLIINRRAGDASTANFLGGISTVERINLGYDATVNSGSGALNLNGGTLYVGAGGILASGSGTFTATITLTNGVLGANANWSSSRDMILATGGAVSFKSSNLSDTPFDITLTGVLSGSGGFTKTGLGKLELGGANTFTGNVTLNAGLLNVTGSLGTGGTLTVNSGGTLGGTGTINKAIVLNSDGVIAPAAAALGTLSGSTVTWNGGGKIVADLGANSDQLALTGALVKGSPGVFRFLFNGTPSVGTTYTLATFLSTTFDATDFSYSGLSGVTGTFSISSGKLLFAVSTGGAPDAAFNTWASTLPAGQRGPQDDPDGDGLPNLLEFALGLDAAKVNGQSTISTTISLGGLEYPAITYTRRVDRGGVVVSVGISTSLDFLNSLGAVEVSATPAAPGFETVVTRSSVPLSVQPTQFLRVSVTLPTE